MFSTEDTIVAIATPPGRGGIGVVRLSGPAARRIAHHLVTHPADLEPRRATVTLVRGAASASGPDTIPGILDQVVVTCYPEGDSYTGDEVVELSAHGSPVVLRAIVASATAHGARLAEPGEFTLRAFLNGRLDLPQAEAVADLVDAVTPLQARVAFDQLQGTATRAIAGVEETLFDLVAKLEASIDFPDEGYHFLDPGSLHAALSAIAERLDRLIASGARGRLIREGRTVAFVGAPNVGKSSLFNALVGSARAIVTPVPGTTRDLVTEVVDLEGIRVTLVDTAGLRETQDVVEAEGVSRSLGAAAVAEVVVHVFDGTSPVVRRTESEPSIPAVRPEQRVIEVTNKADCESFVALPGSLVVSAVTGAGVDRLRHAILDDGQGNLVSGDCPEISNIRHLGLLRQALTAIREAQTALAASQGTLSEEFVLAFLGDARAALEEISGRRSTEDLLAHVFSRFCIGK